jgi:hypothetical protein
MSTITVAGLLGEQRAVIITDASAALVRAHAPHYDAVAPPSCRTAWKRSSTI